MNFNKKIESNSNEVLFIASPILRIDKFKSLLVALGLISLGVLVLYLKQGYIFDTFVRYNV